MLKGLRRKNPKTRDIRVPISLKLLKRLIVSLQKVCTSRYEIFLFSAAFSIAFFVMLRVSEVTIKSRSDKVGHTLNFENVSFQKVEAQTGLRVLLEISKTDQKHKSVTLAIHKQQDSDICPIQLLQSYLAVRFSGVNGSSKLFVHFDGSGLTRFQFCSVLQKCLRFCNVPLHIRTHSFRIGRATDLAKNGVDEETIKQCGRWSSKSYLRYIRL